jgi:hypothetical protein
MWITKTTPTLHLGEAQVQNDVDELNYGHSHLTPDFNKICYT